jgi:hypothetical protein
MKQFLTGILFVFAIHAFVFSQAPYQEHFVSSEVEDVSMGGVDAVSLDNETSFVLGKTYSFDPTFNPNIGGMPIEGYLSYYSIDIVKLSKSSPEPIWKKQFELWHSTWVSPFQPSFFMLQGNLYTIFNKDYGWMYCDSANHDFNISMYGIKHGIAKLSIDDTASFEASYSIAYDYWCGVHDIRLAFLNNRNEIGILYVNEYDYSVYLSFYDADLKLLTNYKLEDFSHSFGRAISYCAYDNLLYIRKHKSLMCLTLEGEIIFDIPLETIDYHNHYFIDVNDEYIFCVNSRYHPNISDQWIATSYLTIFNKKGEVLSERAFLHENVADIVITPQNSLYILSYRRAAPLEERTLSVSRFDMDLNEVGSKKFLAPCVTPLKIKIYNENEFLVTGRQDNSHNFEGGTSPDQVYFLRSSVDNLDSFYYNTELRDLILLYPNPSAGDVYIEAFYFPGVLELYSIGGKRILTFELNNATEIMRTANLPYGLYLWKYTLADGSIETGKWIKK